MIDIGYSVVGVVNVTVTNADGSIESRTTYNKTMNYALQSIMNWMSGTSTATIIAPTQIGAGNGSGTVTANDTALWSPIDGTQRTCDSITITNGYIAQYNITYQTTDPIGYYNELGLFDSNGNMWAHVAINQYKGTGQTLTVQWMVYLVNDTSNTAATITSYMRTSVAKWLTGTSNVSGQPGAVVPPSSIQLGTGSGTPQVTDTALWTPAAGTTKTCDFIQIVQTYNIQFAATYKATDPTGTYTECGWVDSGGNLWVHATINATKSGPNLLGVVGQVGIVGN